MRALGRHILADLAEHLAGHHLPSTVDEILDVLLPRLATQRRSDFLTDLGTLLPCLVGQDTAATDRLAISMTEAGRWWH
ncbi:hypothetical protein GCM10011578_096990 [Streptomyces fuscichromogenes]|uniref:Uncharacterized protein n=1 Tax=Streptomyces fuscichromogenes TaxID=1324013 RepID=A0A917XQE6_9ACTN|nr:hypothetical protein GCM10011578_096990 [Streptomyces fuscichromogenes]